MENYWTTVLSRRLSRRRALAVTGATAAGAAFLAACGGDSNDSGGFRDDSGLVTRPADETGQARRGGVLVNRTTSEPNTMEPHLFPGNFTAQQTYSGMWRIKDGVIRQTSGELEGDVFESWEVSPDRLTITAKVNGNAHFAPTEPVNGRSVDAQDVAATFARHKGMSNQRAEFANEINPNAPIVSITATDNRTVVIRLNEPNAAVMALLARGTPGSMFVVPKESLDNNVLNLARTSVGSGPWYISEFEPGIGHRFKRNPGFKQDPRGEIPYIDEINWPTVPEYASFLAQFRAGAIHLASGIRAEDVLPAKKDIPQLEVLPTYFTTRIQRIGFGLAPDSPFRDDRLRQAYMMTVDRDLYLETVFNLRNFLDAGMPVDIVYESALQSDTYDGWLLDPKGSDFGPNSKYFNYDLAEAKKLVEAAGRTTPFDAEMYIPARQVVRNVNYWDGLEALIGMTADSGVFKVNLHLLNNYDAEWVPRYHNQSNGPFSGVTVSLSSLAQDPATYLHAYYNSRGPLRQGTDATLDEMTNKIVKEFDEKRRMALAHDIQRYEGEKMYYPRIGGSTGFSLGWPAVRNREVYRGGTMRGLTTNWLDQEKAPFRQS
jgi:ABC-type transport system substrate-binding protein